MKSMLDLFARLALGIYFIVNGDDDMMAMLYASKIVNETANRKTGKPWCFADVPAKLKTQVAEILINDFDLADAVPVEYGGTME